MNNKKEEKKTEKRAKRIDHILGEFA